MVLVWDERKKVLIFVSLRDTLALWERRKPSEKEKIAMTAPVITKGDASSTMAFVMPSSYDASSAPVPTNEGVAIKSIPERLVAVHTFSGTATEAVSAQKAKLLVDELRNCGFEVNGEHELARYNPPFSLPFMRTNEIWVPISAMPERMRK